MPSLELCVSSIKSLLAGWISVVVVAGTGRSEIFDAVMVVSLVAFSNETDIWSRWDTVNYSFLQEINLNIFTFSRETYSKHSTSLSELCHSPMPMDFMSSRV